MSESTVEAPEHVHGVPADQAGVRAALVVLAGAVGSVVWGIVCDKAGKRHPRGRVISMGVLCLISTAVLGAAFGLPLLGVQLSNQAQFALFAVGGFFATCTAGPSAAIVMKSFTPASAPLARRSWGWPRTCSAWRLDRSLGAYCPTLSVCRRHWP